LLRALSFHKSADSAHSEEWKQTLKEHEEKKDRVIEKYKGKCEEKKVERTFILSKYFSCLYSVIIKNSKASVTKTRDIAGYLYHLGIACTATREDHIRE